MKKLLVSMLVVVVAVTMSLSVFAAVSPVSVGEFKVTLLYNASGELLPMDSSTYTVNDDGTITLTRSADSKYEFEGWKVEGEYEIVSGSLTGDTVTIRPLSDITITEMYKLDAAGAVDDGDKSPPTGSKLLAFGTVALLSLSAAYVAKKRLTA